MSPFGNISPFQSNGQPSTNSNTTAFTGGPWTFTKTAEAGIAETIVTFSVTDDSTASLVIGNGTSTGSAFTARITGNGGSTRSAFDLVAAGETDSGAVGVMTFQARIGANSNVNTRPCYTWANRTTSLMSMSAAGGLTITGGSTPSLTVGASGTAITQTRVYSPSITPAAVAALTSAEQTFTVTGLTTADKVLVNSIAALGDGLAIVGVRVSAADTLAIRFGNFTAGSLTPAAGVYPVVATRS